MSMATSDDIAAAIRTRQVQTPLDRVRLYTATEGAADAVRALDLGGFDFAPVLIGGEIGGYIRTDDLRGAAGPLAAHVRQLTATCLVSGDAPLAALLQALRRAPFLFVIDGHAIVGIVTPSDLNKQPGRTYFYLLVAELELSVAERVRQYFPDQSAALACLPATRRGQVHDRLAAASRDDVIADAVAAMDLTDLLVIVKKTDALRLAFGDYSATRWHKEVCGPAVALRHDVMHTVRTLATDAPSSLARLIALDERLRTLLAVES